MKIQHKTLMYRIDKISLVDLDDLIEEACGDGVPEHASVVIRTDGFGNHVVFEWVEREWENPPSADYKPNIRKPIKAKWYQYQSYFGGDSKPYKQL